MRVAIFSAVIVLAVAVVMAWSAPMSGISSSAVDGPFRDGFHVGKLTASRGDNPRIPYARWANASDRASFAVGYKQGYAQQMAALRDNNGQQHAPASRASYQDGLYLGRLDGSQGKTQHIAAGRWSKAEDRASFTNGYLRGYERAFSGNSEASLPDLRPITN